MSTETATTSGSSELIWFKSSYSGGEGGECVEVATTPSTTHVRDSKKPGAAQLTVAPESWTVFVSFATDC
ncbi:hypothetical protein GCM10010358_07240 [Streptomyces minutiscleroticus]|uniref:DUF397 domain-containing protein n=1 Tax=Streptomyces minutiscleroticus TaxID=68238 RepID=A0A918K9F1_9ACTN|nr:DUF397 domain-containing protein [Streptomyces minutiscleroticus]GGX55895.1 hypothetical protein GCM10010358_07240 [Streptomyces minutiscleroticus]